MKLCSGCRRRLPLAILYIGFLAGVLAYAGGAASDWNLLVMAGVFLISGFAGVLHVYCCSCRLCRFFRHEHGHSVTASHRSEAG